MTLDDILVLGRMGFNLEQVKTLANAQSSEQIPQQAAAQAPAQVPAPAPAPAPAQAHAPAAAQATKGIDDILSELGIIKDTMQASALLGAQQPKQRTTDDILAEIINPPIVKAGEN